MPKFTKIVRIPAKTEWPVQPPKRRIWQLTTIVSNASDLGIKFGKAPADFTERLLVNGYSLSCSTYISNDIYLWFDNQSDHEQTAFYSGEEL